LELKDICGNVKPSCPELRSQVKFIEELFKAAGSNVYISDSYKKQLFTGNQPFTVDQKRPMRSDNVVDSLIAFFDKYIEKGKESDVISRFGIPEKATPDRNTLCRALALQMKAIIDTDEQVAPDIVGIEYQSAKSGDVSDSRLSWKPLYPGDDLAVDFRPAQRYEIQSHEVITHTWSIQNRGTQVWKGRRLVYIRDKKNRPEANPSVIEIPVTMPNDFVRVTTAIDGRGFDAVTRCVWEMQDKDGENCFPGRDSLFCVTIDAKFKRN